MFKEESPEGSCRDTGEAGGQGRKGRQIRDAVRQSPSEDFSQTLEGGGWSGSPEHLDPSERAELSSSTSFEGLGPGGVMGCWASRRVCVFCFSWCSGKMGSDSLPQAAGAPLAAQHAEGWRPTGGQKDPREAWGATYRACFGVGLSTT